MNREPTLSNDRLNRRREHLMREITLEQTPAAISPTATIRAVRPGRRRGLVGAFAGVAVAAAVVVAVTLPGSSGGPAAFDVQRISNDTVSIRIVNTAVDAKEMTRQLHRQGLNIFIDTMPASPQLVGFWLTSSFSGDVPESVASALMAQRSPGYTATVELPVSFRGEIRLGIGRATRPGEEVQVGGMPNALAPGGRLACLHASGGDPQTVRTAVEALGYTVQWDSGQVAKLEPIPAPLAGQRVVIAIIDDATPAVVRLFVAAPGTRRYRMIRFGYSPQQWSAPPTAACTHA